MPVHCESYLCWFPKFDSYRSSAVQLETVQPETPSRWSCTTDSLLRTSYHAVVHIPQPLTRSLHAWTQGDTDCRLKSSAHQVRAEIPNSSTTVKHSTDTTTLSCENTINKCNTSQNRKQKVTVRTSSISLIHRSMPSNDHRFVMSYTSTMPYMHTCQLVKLHIRHDYITQLLTSLLRYDHFD